MNPSDTSNLRRVVLKRKKDDVAPVARKPSRILVVINPRPEGALVTPLEAAPLATSKRSLVLKAGASSSAPHSITFEEVSDN